MISGPTVVEVGGKLELLGSVSKKLQVKLSGKLDEKYIWMKDNQPVETCHPKPLRDFNNDHPKLILEDVDLNDTGTYTLQVGEESSNELMVIISGKVFVKLTDQGQRKH
jgi:hypothetical protein